MSSPRDTIQDLVDLTSRLTRDRTLEDALQQLADAQLRLLPAEQVAVELLDDTRTEVVAAARAGEAGGELPSVVPWVCEHLRELRIEDTRADERVSRAGFRWDINTGVIKLVKPTAKKAAKNAAP